MKLANCFFTLIIITAALSNTIAQDHPNIILIVADDLGFGDLQCYGAVDTKTPNIDRLSKEGVRFTGFYSNGPECTPTRAALLTGRYQQRVGGLECAIGLGNVGRYPEALKLSNEGQLGLPADFSVLPGMLKEKGYTSAIIGKWHLGDGAEFRPQAHGFDYSIGPMGGGVDYFHHTEPVGTFLGTPMKGDHDLFRNDEPHQRDGYYMTHLITDESVEWINRQRKDKPFFLYIPFTSPHEPLQGPGDYKPEKLTMEFWNKGDHAKYISLVEDLDKSVGKILNHLDEQGLAENTIVIFCSDNGPTANGSAGKFSGLKGHVFEGGIRVPCLVRWPGKIHPGTTSEQIAITMDLTVSLARIVGASTSRPLDGMDIIGHVTEGKTDVARTLFWRIKRGETERKAVRDGGLKYIHEDNAGVRREFLFDLASDPAEENNLANARQKDLKRLKTLLKNWESDVQPERYKR